MAEAVPELALEPLPGELPQAVGFSPERVAPPVVDSIGAIPEQVVEKVTIAPPSSWVVERELESPATTATPANPWFLLDRQLHAEHHAFYQRVVRKLDTINAVREAGQWRIDFDPRQDRLTIHSLAVIRRGERMENARLERLRVLQREMGLESLVLEGLLTVVVLLEDVRVGDMLDLSYTVQGRPLIFPDHFSRTIFVPDQVSLRAFHLSVRFAAGRGMQWKSSDPQLGPAIREEEGETEWSWKTNVTPVQDGERNVPARDCLGKWIQISDFASWADVASGLAAAWQEDLDDPEIVRLAESIAAECETAALRGERALTFLQDEVRYLSVSGDLGGRVPTAPGQVVKQRFGDCKDKSFAAAHLLRRLGIPARPVIVHTVLGRAAQDFLPTPNAFNHAIVEYEIEGKRRWVDVTVQLQGGTALTRPGAGFGLGLPIGPGVSQLEPIVIDTSGDRIELRETFFIDTTGRSSSLRVSVIAAGREADRWRRSVAEAGVEEFAQTREQYFQRIFPNAKRVGTLKWEDDRENNEFLLGEVFDLHEFAAASFDRRAVRFRLSAHTIQAVLGFHQVGKRQNRWVLQYPCRIRHIIEIDSPSMRKPKPIAARVDGRAFRFSTTWQGHQGLTCITFTLQILKSSVPAAEFEAFKEEVREVWRHTSIVGNLPPGSAVSWKKRSPENALPGRRGRAPVQPRRERTVPSENIALPEVAAPCASAGTTGPNRLPGGREAASGVVPRKERAIPVHEPVPAGERGDIQRPNPYIGAPNPARDEAASAARRAKRRARRRQRSIVWTVVIILGFLIVALILFALNLT